MAEEVESADSVGGDGDRLSGPETNDTSSTLVETVIVTVSVSLCICVTIVGNIFVILSVFTYRPLRSVQNFYIVSLACADLAVTLLVMPLNAVNFALGRWVFGPVVCNVWLTCDVLTCTASILHLCAIAVDRYQAIASPIEYAQKRTLRRVLAGIGVVWALSALISVPPLVGWNHTGGGSLYDAHRRSCRLTDERGYVIYSAAGSFFIPLTIMTFVYVKIFAATRRRLRARAKGALVPVKTKTKTPRSVENQQPPSDQNEAAAAAADLIEASGTASSFRRNDVIFGSALETSEFSESRQRISLTKERRVARTMAVIMGAFVVCWLPFFLMYVIFPFCASCSAAADRRVVNLVVWLGYVNSTLNPIIYTVFNVDFRRAFHALIFKSRLLRRRTAH